MTNRYDMHYEATREGETPYTKSSSRNGEFGPTHVQFRDGVKLKRPRGRLLPITAYRAYERTSMVSSDGTYKSADHVPGGTLQSGSAFTLFDDFPSELLLLKSRAAQAALEKADGDLGDNPMTLVNLGETDSSLKTIEKRLVQCYRGFSALRRLDFFEAAVVWNLVRDSKPKSRRLGKHGRLRWTKHPIRGKYYPRPVKPSLIRRWSKDLAGAILEYNFAWKPAIQDIQTAVAALDRPIAYDKHVERQATLKETYTRRVYTSSFTHSFVHDVSLKCKLGFVIGIENPNYELASRLGLVDLASTAVELMPFSFVLNWFVNLDSYVRQLSLKTDPRVHHPWHSFKLSDRASHQISMYSGGEFVRIAQFHETMADSYERIKGLPSISLTVRPVFVTSLAKAVNMSALIVQLFGRSR